MTSAPVARPWFLGIRVVRILWRLLTPLALVLLLVLTPGWLGASPPVVAQARVVGWFVLAFAAAVALVKEVLSPARPGLRLVPVSDARAVRLTNIVAGLAFVLLATELAIFLIRANDWSPAAARLVSIARTAALVVVGAALVGRLGLIRRLRPATTETWSGLVRQVLVRVGWPVGIAMALFHVVASGLGYVGLAQWVTWSAAMSLLAILGVALAVRFLDRRTKRTLQLIEAEAAERRGEGTAGPSPALVGVERILSGALKVGGWIAAFALLKQAWDPRGEFVASLANDALVRGGPTWGALTTGFVRVVFVILLGAFVRTVLIFLVFPRIDLDAGIRYAVLTILRYIVWVVTAMILLETLGIDTSALAIFAGAFGVGLAFGLQDIFANFFSGLIMLLERPVRIGDSIEVAGTAGTVEAIRLRGTRLRTPDETTVTIPNRQMIGERLTNLTWDMPRARLVVNVGVAYEADQRLVEMTLLDVARRDGRVMKDPPPHARLVRFGASSVDWVLRCWTDRAADRHVIVSDLHRAVFAAFQRANIEIPFPQQEVRLRGTPGDRPPGV